MFPISSNQLDFDQATKIFSAEISMLDDGGKRQVWCQAYNDACDEGIRMVSAKTGKEVMYVVYHKDEVAGEIQGWHLIPTDESVRLVPECKGTKMFIVND